MLVKVPTMMYSMGILRLSLRRGGHPVRGGLRRDAGSALRAGARRDGRRGGGPVQVESSLGLGFRVQGPIALKAPRGFNPLAPEM
jgi:hypothetical protein